MAGSEEQTPALTTEELCDMILSVAHRPVERGTLYNEIKEYTLNDTIA